LKFFFTELTEVMIWQLWTLCKHCHWLPPTNLTRNSADADKPRDAFERYVTAWPTLYTRPRHVEFDPSASNGVDVSLGGNTRSQLPQTDRASLFLVNRVKTFITSSLSTIQILVPDIVCKHVRGPKNVRDGDVAYP